MGGECCFFFLCVCVCVCVCFGRGRGARNSYLLFFCFRCYCWMRSDGDEMGGTDGGGSGVGFVRVVGEKKSFFFGNGLAAGWVGEGT